MIDGNVASIFWLAGMRIAGFDAVLLSIMMFIALAVAVWLFGIPSSVALVLGILFCYANYLLFPSQITFVLFLGSLAILGGVVFLGLTALIKR